jgi:hypothetical protein
MVGPNRIRHPPRPGLTVSVPGRIAIGDGLVSCADLVGADEVQH